MQQQLMVVDLMQRIKATQGKQVVYPCKMCSSHCEETARQSSVVIGGRYVLYVTVLLWQISSPSVQGMVVHWYGNLETKLLN